MADTGNGQGVCPVSVTDLSIERAGRVLLSIAQLELGSSDEEAITAIVGPNGAGKSLLVRTLCALLEPDTGKVAWAGRAPDIQRRHRVGLLLQKPVLLRRSALANLSYTLRQTGLDRSTSRSIGIAALERAGLSELADVTAARLSGGEQQRLALVRALLLRPDILFLDEATANVDPASTLVIEQQLQQAAAAGLRVVLVSHDQAQVRRLADRLILIHKGQVIEQAAREQFFNAPRQPLTRRWIEGDLLV